MATNKQDTNNLARIQLVVEPAREMSDCPSCRELALIHRGLAAVPLAHSSRNIFNPLCKHFLLGRRRTLSPSFGELPFEVSSDSDQDDGSNCWHNESMHTWGVVE